MLVPTPAADKSHEVRGAAKPQWQSFRIELWESLNFFLDDLQRTSTMAPSHSLDETACNVELPMLFSDDLGMNFARKK